MTGAQVKEGDFDLPRRLLETAVKAEPKNSDNLMDLSRVLNNLGAHKSATKNREGAMADYREAQTQATRALEYNPARSLSLPMCL